MINKEIINQFVSLALAEDIGHGDVTSQAIFTNGEQAVGQIIAQADGVVSGLIIAKAVFESVDPSVKVHLHTDDGFAVQSGNLLMEVRGNTSSLLTAERTALNFLQHLSGVSTLTRKYVTAVEDTGAWIADTRKTTPGLRLAEKYAVKCGGGRNHRFGLDDGVMIKDNHISAAGSIINAIQKARQSVPHTLKIEVECDTLEQVDTALEGGADILLLDNMSVSQLKTAVSKAKGKALLEASGGVSLETVREIALTGVDLISVGALTHSAPILQMHMEVRMVDRSV